MNEGVDERKKDLALRLAPSFLFVVDSLLKGLYESDASSLSCMTFPGIGFEGKDSLHSYRK